MRKRKPAGLFANKKVMIPLLRFLEVTKIEVKERARDSKTS